MTTRNGCIKVSLMSEAVHNFPPEQPRTTRAAEGLLRRRFTTADVETMVAAGIIEENERVELIGGDLVPMTPKSLHHEVLKQALNIYWGRQLPEHYRFSIATTLRLAPDTYLEPDFVFYDAATGLQGLNGKTAHLVVEIADLSFAYDIGPKALLYAIFGIRELWVIDAESLKIHVHTKPSLDGFGDVKLFRKNEVLKPAFAHELAVKLGDLKL